jgi:hypothetical protein
MIHELNYLIKAPLFKFLFVFFHYGTKGDKTSPKVQSTDKDKVNGQNIGK